MNCTICGKKIELTPSAAERAAKDTSGKPVSYFTKLFTEHADCVIKKRSKESSELLNRKP